MSTREDKIKILSKKRITKYQEDKCGRYLSIKELILWDKDGILDRIKNQRPYVGKKDFINSIINDLIHECLRLPQIRLFIILEDEQDPIDVNDFVRRPTYYMKKGYHLVIVDGSQRIRTLLGFVLHILELPKLIGPDEDVNKITKNTECVSKVWFNELPKDIQKNILKKKISISINQGSFKDYIQEFHTQNTNKTQLNQMELNHNIYGYTQMWKDLTELLHKEYIFKLLNLKESMNYDMNDVSDDGYYSNQDRGAALNQIFKMVMHTDDYYLHYSVSDSVDNFTEKYSDDTKWNEFFPIIKENFEIFKMLNPCVYSRDYKTCMNRMRSVYAAIIAVRKKGLDFEGNIDAINNVFEHLMQYIPSTKSGCGKKENINAEIDMYIAILRFIINNGEEDDAEVFQYKKIESMLTFDLDGVHYELYPKLCDIYSKLYDNVSA